MTFKAYILLFFLLLNAQNLISGFNNSNDYKNFSDIQTKIEYIPEYSALCCRLGMVFCCDME